MSREGKLVKNTIILALGTFFPKLAVFITLPILTDCLTHEQYGTYDIVLTLVALLLPAATLQIQSAAFRFLVDVQHDEKEKKSIISNIYAFILPTSAVALILMFIVWKNQDIVIRLAICAYLLFDIISNTNKQIIRGLSKNIDYAISAFISAFGQVALTFFLILGLKKELLGAIIALTTAEFLSATFLTIRGEIYKYIDIKEVNKAKLKELLAYSWPMVPNSLSQWVIHLSDRFIILYFMGPVYNSIYAVAYRIPSILNLAQTTFNMAWQENASIVSKDDDVQKYYSTMFEWLFDIIAGAMAMLIGFTPIIFKILVRGDYSDAYIHFPILYMGTFFYCLSTFWGGIFVGLKKTVNVGMTTVLAAVIHLVIVLSLIHFIGLFAASISCVVSYFALCAFRLIGVQKLLKINYKVMHIVLVILLLIVMCIICSLRMPVFNVINAVAGTAIGIILNRNIIKIFIKKVFFKIT